MYGRCSDVLHAENPFSRNEDDVVAFLFQEIPQWMNKIITLLNHHNVFPVDEERMYIVLMKSKDDGRAHMTEFERIDKTSG